MFVYGRNSVEEALKEHLRILRMVVLKEKRMKFIHLVDMATKEKIPVEVVSEKELMKLAGTQKHQGIALEIALPPTVYENENDFDGWDKLQRVLILDGITDTGNFGALLRSALLFGMDAVLVPEDHSARVTPQVIRASAGALYRIPLVYVRNIVTTTQRLKALGFSVYGLDMNGNEELGKIVFRNPLAIVVGSEDKGMRRMMRRSCDSIVRIPTTEKLDSLNASVATAVCLWEVYKQFFVQGGKSC